MKTVSFTKCGIECSRTSFDVFKAGSWRGQIRYLDRCALNIGGSNGPPGWYFLAYPSGRTESFATLAEAKDEARKL